MRSVLVDIPCQEKDLGNNQLSGIPEERKVMKEEEAKKKVCKRIPVCTEVNKNEYDTKQQRFYDIMTIMCLGSECMVWRKEKDTYGDDYGKDIPDDLGYCGLAGRI